jgi:putative ABC transport system ATP-binding protein
MTEGTRRPLLSARSLRAALPSEAGEVAVLDGISFDLASGEIVDITGPSGSGKTTLLRALARLLPSATGELTLRGMPACEIPPQQWRTEVALMPQKPVIVVGCIRDNLLVPWRFKLRAHEAAPDDAALSEALAEVALDDLALERDSARLSVGQQARVAMVRVMLTRPAVLLLDEPDAALDHASAEAVHAMVARFAERGGAVTRVRHRGDDGLAGRRLSLAGGRLTEVLR